MSKSVGHIILTIRVHEGPDGYFLATCQELEVPSFGETLDEALHAVMDAVTVYLNTLEAEGEIDRVLAERGVKVHPGAHDPTSKQTVTVEARPMEVVSPWALPLPVG